MQREEIKDLVREVLGPNTPMEDAGGWVSLPCPLAPWTHDRGRDTRPSAGISVKDGDESVFNCFTCHRKGPLSWLLRTYSEFSGEDYYDLADSVAADAFLGGVVPVWGSTSAQQAVLTPLNKQEHFGLYEPALGHPYLAKRGVSRWATQEAELMFDPGDRGEPRIIFPVYGLDKQLYGFSGRAINPRARLKVKDYYGLPKKHLLLGAHLVHPQDQYILLVEGLMDYAVMLTYGYTALAFMSSTLTQAQADIVKDIGKPVYFFHDDDTAGRDARDRAKDFLCRHVPVMKVQYPKEDTVETPEGGLRPPADPAELTKRQTQAMLESARLL